jgi:predicted transport protein
MNNSKNVNNNTFSIIISIIIIIVLLLFIIYYYSPIIKIDNKVHSYNIHNLKGTSDHMLSCPNGCIRGVCNKNNSNNKNNTCNYDFNCQYCIDKNTKNFYVNFNKERNIIPVLEEEENLNLSQKTLLNNYIQENNNYIKELNTEIKNYNNKR